MSTFWSCKTATWMVAWKSYKHTKFPSKDGRMLSIPHDATAVLGHFSVIFTQPTYQRFLLLLISCILTTGRRTTCNLLRTVGPCAKGDPSSFHRFFSAAQWSALGLACVLARLVVKTFCPKGPILLAGDDTVDEHRGKKVYGKGRHRDAVRSSHSYTTYRYGHKWVVVAVLVKLPLTSRYWALPVLVDLYRPKKVNEAEKRRHRTPVEIMIRLLRVLLRWFPDRDIIFTGDSGFGTHELTSFAHQHKPLALVSRFYANANLYEPPAPPQYNKRGGRPRKKGAKLPSPQEVVAQTKKRQKLKVAWYGGGTRQVEVVSGVGHWYKSGAGLVAVRWVYVHDVSGTHRDDYLFSTAVTLTPKEIIEIYTRRWNIETTFQEMRSYLGLESTRGWKRQTVLRAAPSLFGVYSMVVLLYQQMPKEQHEQVVSWSGKETISFSDAITSVRRWLWSSCIFETAGHEQTFSKLPQDLRKILLYSLAPAA